MASQQRYYWALVLSVYSCKIRSWSLRFRQFDISLCQANTAQTGAPLDSCLLNEFATFCAIVIFVLGHFSGSPFRPRDGGRFQSELHEWILRQRRAVHRHDPRLHLAVDVRVVSHRLLRRRFHARCRRQRHRLLRRLERPSNAHRHQPVHREPFRGGLSHHSRLFAAHCSRRRHWDLVPWTDHVQDRPLFTGELVIVTAR